MLKPMNDKVIIRRVAKKEITDGGLVIPLVAQKHTNDCEVVACGPGRLLEDGSRAPMSVKPGDVVIIPSKVWANEFSYEGEKLLAVDEGTLLAVYEP